MPEPSKDVSQTQRVSVRRLWRQMTFVRLLIAILVLNAIYWPLDANFEWAARHGLADVFGWTMIAVNVIGVPVVLAFLAKFFLPKSP